MDFAVLPAAGLAGFLGLLIGSFLNVVIYRLPKMMERQWAAEITAYQAEKENSPSRTEEPPPRKRPSISWFLGQRVRHAGTRLLGTKTSLSSVTCFCAVSVQVARRGSVRGIRWWNF